MQLSLFDWTPPTAAMSLLPWSPSVPLVRETAIALHGAPDALADEFWQSALRFLADPLMAAGVPNDVIRAHLLNFRDAVSVALDRLDGRGPDGDPGLPMKPTTMGRGAFDGAQARPLNDNQAPANRRAANPKKGSRS